MMVMMNINSYVVKGKQEKKRRRNKIYLQYMNIETRALLQTHKCMSMSNTSDT